MDSMITTLLQQGGFAAVAALAMWMQHQQYRHAMAREQEHSAIQREDKLALLSTLQANATASQQLSQTVAELTRVIERIDRTEG